MLQKQLSLHTRCIAILDALKNENDESARNLYHQMYANNIIELIRQPMEAILDASQPNAVPLPESFFEAASIPENVLCGSSVPQYPMYDVFKYIGDMTKPKNMPY